MSDPLISVIVPVLDAEHFITACLESLLAVDYPASCWEVIVVDNGCRDATRSIVRRYPVKLLEESIPGSTAARNKGITSARGEIIAFTDADCRVRRDWARQLAASFTDATVDAVIGFAEGINENLHAHFVQRRWEESRFQRVGDRYQLKQSGIDTRNCALRPRVFEQLGSFDASVAYCGDLEMGMRLNEAGYRTVFNPQLVVAHKNPTSFRIVLDKSRKQRDFVLAMRSRISADADWSQVPFPASAFYGAAELTLWRPLEFALLVLLKLLCSMLFGVVSMTLYLGVNREWAYKLYKVFFGLSYDIAIIEARRNALPRPGSAEA